MPPQPGQMFSQCRLEQQIGVGGMGVVWKALDTSLNRHVAIKILPPHLTADVESRMLFKREAESAAALAHPNIAVIHQVGEQDGTPFIVMQLLEGRTLREVIREGPMPPKPWLRTAAALADGLAHAHAQGIIHRDLKPDNVMITTDGQVKILDFGLAGALGTAPGSVEPTNVAQAFGTLSYMSPEQARGEQTDHRSDIFSLGILLYELASGQKPFKGETDQETLAAIVAAAPGPLAEAGAALPAEAERVLRKAMEKEPERRYQHADEMATDVRNLQRDLTSGRVSTLPPAAHTPAAGAGGGAAPALPPARKRRGAPAVVGALAAVALLAFVVFRFGTGTPPESISSGPGAASGAAAGGLDGEADHRKMIVVLPFDNLGLPEDGYFAAGITEEITSRLAAVEGLGVISRTSALQYAGSGSSIKEIGQELNVSYVLEGTVRWARSSGGASRVRITPQLIRVSDDTHLWSETYDEVIDDIFAVQSDIAAQVIEQTGIALLDTQREILDTKPTENIEAYRFYVRGMNALRSPDFSRESFQLQVDMFERAVRLDSDFALAHAALSRAHAGFYHLGFDRTPARQDRALQAVDRARQLSPDLPEVQLALGFYHYWCHKDYEPALQAFAMAQRGMPASAEPIIFVGYIYRRQGDFQRAASNLETAFRLSPRDSQLALEIGLTQNYLRNYEKAVQFLDMSIALTPDTPDPYLLLAETYWRWKGTTQEARVPLEAMPAGNQSLAVHVWFLQEIFEGKFGDALARLGKSPEEVLRHYRFVRPTALLRADAHELAGDSANARAEYEAARILLEREVAERPDDHRAHGALGLALAGLGRKEEAIEAGRMALEVYPLSGDTMFGVFPMSDLALIYTRVGEPDAALDQIESLLSKPSLLSVPLLRLDPRFAPLRDHPRYMQLIRP